MPKSMITTVLAFDHDVGRLEVAVNHARGVRRLETRSELADEEQSLGDRQVAGRLELGRQIAAIDERHRDVFGAFDFADVVDADDVVVGDLTCEQQLALEPFFELLRGRRDRRSLRVG